MANSFRNLKEFIPTWIICIVVFFWFLGIPLIAAIPLIIIQHFQFKKIKERMLELEIKNQNKNYSCNDKYEEKDLQIYGLKQQIKDNEMKIQLLEKQLKSEIESKNNSQTVAEETNYENLALKMQIEQMNASTVSKTSSSKNKFILCTGKYKGGLDIPIGTYNLNIISGTGIVETEEPDYVFERLESNPQIQKERNWTDKYCGLDITDKTVLKISENARIEFELIREYNTESETNKFEEIYVQQQKEFEEKISDLKKEYTQKGRDLKNEHDFEKSKLESELKCINNEIEILNNDLIHKYYVFSDYDGITSEDCKNKLLMLKQKEKDMRSAELDVKIYGESTDKWKTRQRSTRQILRTFNAECDNVLFNLKLNNIDASRNKIRKSFESANKLYYIDAVALTNDLLELKLEQVTLMYTYELKYQQEKEIQKAIREQMLEEAKAEREIEEQKKKIEKDLQQHIGEVNRLMKYMQKSQLDLEKEMYMDKIKELEEKIKSLEADKETVLEREANAKAGFVYIISNIGSFGENIYKIGMTRRLEPMDRVKELSSASVPFEFDVHAMIFSSDAPELENMLHKHFADHAVNKVNPRKEFFNVDIDEIERVVKENYNDTVQFTKIPIAAEYRQTLNMNEVAQ